MAYIQRNISKKTGQTINWKVTALLGRDENGKQVRLTKRVAPYDDMTAKAEEKRIQREADEWEAKEKAEYRKQKEKGRDTTSKLQVKRERETITLTEFIDKRWMPNDILRSPKKPKTPDSIAFYANMSTHIKAYWQDARLSQIDKEDILDYLRFLQYDAKTKGGKPYGQTTIYHCFSTLRTILGYAKYLEYIDRNPCEDIRDQDKPGRSHKTQGFLDTEGYYDFLAKLNSEEEAAHWKGRIYTHLYFKCMAIVFINVGLRRGELCGLQWQDIEEYSEGGAFILRRNVSLVSVDPTESESGKKTDIHVGPLKCREDGEYRKVYFGDPVLALLKALRKEQEDAIGAKLMDNAFIFCRANNPFEALYPTTPTRMIALFVKRHHLADLSPHDLRRTSLSVYAENGATIKELQNKAGHSDSRTSTEIYIMASERMQRKTANRIDNQLLASVNPAKEA